MELTDEEQRVVLKAVMPTGSMATMIDKLFDRLAAAEAERDAWKQDSDEAARALEAQTDNYLRMNRLWEAAQAGFDRVCGELNSTNQHWMEAEARATAAEEREKNLNDERDVILRDTDLLEEQLAQARAALERIASLGQWEGQAYVSADDAWECRDIARAALAEQP